MVYLRASREDMTRMERGGVRAAGRLVDGHGRRRGARGSRRSCVAIADAADGPGAVLVNVGNMHTFATLVDGRRMFGLFEHHTRGHRPPPPSSSGGGATAGHARSGAPFARAIRWAWRRVGSRAIVTQAPFRFVGDHGSQSRGLHAHFGYHEAAPHGDMMLAGSFGLVEGVLMKRTAEGETTGLTLAAG